jgi:hypothetical protein
LRATPGFAERVPEAAPDPAAPSFEGSAGFDEVIFEGYVRFGGASFD